MEPLLQEVEAMAEPYLKYRTRFTSSLKNELIPLFNQLAAQTRIPKSRLLDEAIVPDARESPEAFW